MIIYIFIYIFGCKNYTLKVQKLYSKGVKITL